MRSFVQSIYNTCVLSYRVHVLGVQYLNYEAIFLGTISSHQYIINIFESFVKI